MRRVNDTLLMLEWSNAAFSPSGESAAFEDAFRRSKACATQRWDKRAAEWALEEAGQ
jgi:hypothetical protein